MQDNGKLKDDKYLMLAKVGFGIVIVGSLFSFACGAVKFIKNDEKANLIDDFKNSTYYIQEINKQQDENLNEYNSGEIDSESYEQNDKYILSQENAVEILKSSSLPLKLEFNHLEDLSNRMFEAMLIGGGVAIVGAGIAYTIGAKKLYDFWNEDLEEIKE